jgi:hypothetical protein
VPGNRAASTTEIVTATSPASWSSARSTSSTTASCLRRCSGSGTSCGWTSRGTRSPARSRQTPTSWSGSAVGLGGSAAAATAVPAVAAGAAKFGGSTRSKFFGPMAAAPPFGLEDLLRASAEVGNRVTVKFASVRPGTVRKGMSELGGKRAKKSCHSGK